MGTTSTSSEWPIAIPRYPGYPDVGISFWQVYLWPDVFTVGWTPQSSSFSSSSSQSSSLSSQSSFSSGGIGDEYYAAGFTIAIANGCYGRMGTVEHGMPVFSNGSYYLKYGGEEFPKWFLQSMTTLAIHYWANDGIDPRNAGARYNAQIGLGTGGYVTLGCPSSSSLSSISSPSGISSGSTFSSTSSASSQSSPSSMGTSSSSSSYYKNLPVDLASYVSTCRGMSSIQNPATGAQAGVTYSGHFNEGGQQDDETFMNKGWLERTTANRGAVICDNASRLFSMRSGMVSLTIRAPSSFINGVYLPLAGLEGSATGDMILWAANIGSAYITQPGLYAALTPKGIEFTVWSDAGKNTITDKVTSVGAGVDVVLTFAWDFSRRIMAGGLSSAIMVNGNVTAGCSLPIAPGGLDHLYDIASAQSSASSEAEPEVVPANFIIGDSPSGKNGIIGIVLRRIEVYKEPVFILMSEDGNVAGVETVGYPQRSEVDMPFSIEGTKWIGIEIDEPEFGPASDVEVNLLDTGAGRTRQTSGEDVGKEETRQYPEIPDDLPFGIEEAEMT